MIDKNSSNIVLSTLTRIIVEMEISEGLLEKLKVDLANEKKLI